MASCCAGISGSSGRATGSGAPAEPVQGLGQDRGAVGVVAPFLHVGQVRLVRLGVRRGGRVRLVLAGRETAAGAVPSLRHRGVAGETGHGLVLVAAPEGNPDPRRGLAALGLAHRSRAYPAATDGVATAHCYPLPSLTTSLTLRAGLLHTGLPPAVYLISKPSATMHRNHRTPVKIVIRSRFRSTTDDEPRDDETPPPKRSDRPPPLPLWSRTSKIISKLVMIRTTDTPISTAVSRPSGHWR